MWQNLAKKSLPWLLLILFFFGGQVYMNRELIKHTPPHFEGITVQGQPFALEQLKGKPALIYFWASWCSICRLMENSISNLSNNAALISVAMQSGSDDTIHQYLLENKLQTPVINDDKGILSSRYGVQGVPTLFFLNPQGEIAYAVSGYSPGWLVRARLWLAGL
ncbi:MAG TPA: protein disulfide oxidoreductase [Pseudomonadales bacterium]|nr:protein disulfide oxidoreductase [Pseudomonadales bacterium]